MVFAVLSLLLACSPESGPPGPSPTEEIRFCEGGIPYDYDPVAALTTFPDDWWTVDDPDAGSGRRVSIDPDAPALAEFPDAYDNLLVQLSSLDGFGTTPEIVLRFTRDVPDALSLLDVRVMSLGDDGVWTDHPATSTAIDSDRTLLIRPWRPLPPASQIVVAVGAALADGSDCVSPSPTLRALLTDPEEPLNARYVAALDALGWSAGDVGALVVYTTQSAHAADDAVLADVDSRDLSLDAPMDCETSSAWRRCEGTVTVGDYRGADGVVPAQGPLVVQREYALPVTAWLPLDDVAGPHPVMLCGHGLTGSRSQCRFAADLAAPLGVAVLSVDAQEHGDHPARTQQGDGLDEIMALCGFTLIPTSFDALILRDNFRASAWDKLQVLRAVQSGWDVDGDGEVDLDGDQVQYAGASLGGIMGPQLLALAPELSTGVLVVPGGGLMDLFIHSESFGLIATAMTPGDWDEDDLARVVPMLQALIDAGDPLVSAARLSRERAAGAERAHVALLMAFEDSVVPNLATARLAQAFGVSTVGAELMTIPGVDVVSGSVAGNLVDGATGGLLQLDRVQHGDGGDWEVAEHSYVHDSIQGEEVLVPFMTAALDDAVPELIDPYADAR